MPDPVPTWNGSRVFRLGGIRHLVNFWRLREFTDDGFRVVFYRSRAGVVILSVTVVVA